MVTIGMEPRWRLVQSACSRTPRPSLASRQPRRLRIERTQQFGSTTQRMPYQGFKRSSAYHEDTVKYAERLHNSRTRFNVRPITDRQVQLLGFKNAASTFALSRSMILTLMRMGSDPRGSAGFLIHDEGARMKKALNHKSGAQDIDLLLSDVPVLSEVLYLVAKSALNQENQRAWERLAIYTLGVAVELGNERAAIDLFRLESLRSDHRVTGTVHTVVKRLAESKRDWRAMSVYIDYLLKNPSTPATRKEAYELAKDLYEMTQPGTNDPGYLRPQDQVEPAWKLLRDAADQHLYDVRNGPEADVVQETYDRAIREGVIKYSDPEACIQLAGNLSVKADSKAWLDLKTKSAMAGDVESCFDIARYWLEKDGWYPAKSSPRSLTAENQIGFDWMDLAASGSETAQKMASRYLIIALILRENGLAKEGRDWLEAGMNRLEEQERLFESNDRSDPAEVKEIGTWIGKLADFASNWNETFGANAAQLLGEPVLK